MWKQARDQHGRTSRHPQGSEIRIWVNLRLSGGEREVRSDRDVLLAQARSPENMAADLTG
jgi:hypothetical protein